MSQGDLSILVDRPISGALLAVIALVLVGSVFGAMSKRRKAQTVAS